MDLSGVIWSGDGLWTVPSGSSDAENKCYIVSRLTDVPAIEGVLVCPGVSYSKSACGDWRCSIGGNTFV